MFAMRCDGNLCSASAYTCLCWFVLVSVAGGCDNTFSIPCRFAAEIMQSLIDCFGSVEGFACNCVDLGAAKFGNLILQECLPVCYGAFVVSTLPLHL